MKDMKAQLDLLIEQAAECALISTQAKDKTTQDLFARLAGKYSLLASEVEKAMVKIEGDAGSVKEAENGGNQMRDDQ